MNWEESALFSASLVLPKSFSGFVATNATILRVQRVGERYPEYNPNSPLGTDHFSQMQQPCFLDFLRLAEQGE